MIRSHVLAASLAGAVMAWAQGVPSVGAQEVASFGSGPDRVCNTLLDKSNRPVLQKGGAAAVDTTHTYACPEAEAMTVAEVAPAAPAPVAALPASGVIYFDLDRAELNDEGAAGLADIIDEIKGRQLGGITIAGYTDTSGTAVYNMALSERRANTVASGLVRAGVPAQIITAEGFGQNDLAVLTADGVVQAANRRVVIDFAH
jgi:outer membrane protein OmpA-like peptidoglycan-associated protein